MLVVRAVDGLVVLVVLMVIVHRSVLVALSSLHVEERSLGGLWMKLVVDAFVWYAFTTYLPTYLPTYVYD